MREHGARGLKIKDERLKIKDEVIEVEDLGLAFDHPVGKFIEAVEHHVAIGLAVVVGGRL